jgi:hypothetical protein
MAIADVNNLHQLYGLLVLGGLGTGGIVVPASIMTTIICPDVSFLLLQQIFHYSDIVFSGRLRILISFTHYIITANRPSHFTGPHRHSCGSDTLHPCHWWLRRLHDLLQRLCQQICSQCRKVHWGCNGDETRDQQFNRH